MICMTVINHEIQCDNIKNTTRVMDTKELINICIEINKNIPEKKRVFRFYYVT
jgi:hypothetical protein